MKEKGFIDWLALDTSANYILGYGSLLSESSRACHSNIVCPSLFVNVSGFQRGWITRSKAEQQTYLGAQAIKGSELNAQLIPVKFDASFTKREQDYEFIQVAPSSLTLVNGLDNNDLRNILKNKVVWICSTLKCDLATREYPVMASYVATCIMGCLVNKTRCFFTNEINNDSSIEHVTQFIKQTNHWPKTLKNDLANPLYPRHADFSHPLFKQATRIMLEQGMIN